MEHEFMNTEISSDQCHSVIIYDACDVNVSYLQFKKQLVMHWTHLKNYNINMQAMYVCTEVYI